MNTVIEQVKKSVGEILGIPVDLVTPEKTLADDLGVDSLDKYEIIMSIEDDLNIEIEDDELYKVVTVADLINLVNTTKTEKENKANGK